MKSFCCRRRLRAVTVSQTTAASTAVLYRWCRRSSHFVRGRSRRCPDIASVAHFIICPSSFFRHVPQ